MLMECHIKKSALIAKVLDAIKKSKSLVGFPKPANFYWYQASWALKEGNSRQNFSGLKALFLPPASAVEVIESVPSVCVCVCVCLSALSRLNRLTYERRFWYGNVPQQWSVCVDPSWQRDFGAKEL